MMMMMMIDSWSNSKHHFHKVTTKKPVACVLHGPASKTCIASSSGSVAISFRSNRTHTHTQKPFRGVKFRNILKQVVPLSLRNDIAWYRLIFMNFRSWVHIIGYSWNWAAKITWKVIELLAVKGRPRQATNLLERFVRRCKSTLLLIVFGLTVYEIRLLRKKAQGARIAFKC